MKVLLINGSPRPNGCTATAFEEMIKIFDAEGVETEIIQVGNKDIRGCISCNTCWERGTCVFDDLVNSFSHIAHNLLLCIHLLLKFWINLYYILYLLCS